MPGSFELPVVAKSMALSGKYNAVVCIGAVVSVAPHMHVRLHLASCKYGGNASLLYVCRSKEQQHTTMPLLELRLVVY